MTAISEKKDAMTVRFIQSVKYLTIQIILDILFCIIAGITSEVYAIFFLDEDFDYVLLLFDPLVYMIPVYVRYVTLLEVIPRTALYNILCGERKYKVWMALIIGIMSYVWSIFFLQWFYGWDQGSWYFPFYDVEGMSIYTVCMIISTLVSPFVINYLKERKARR